MSSDDDSDDAPLSSLANKNDSPSTRKRKPVSYAEESGDEEEEEEAEEEKEDDEEEESSEDDDDVPLAALKKASPAKKPKAKPKAKPAAKKKAKTPVAKEKTAAVKTGDYQSASAALYESGSKKGQLIQKLLCRWWYATVWPDPANIPDKPPKGYDTLDGFPGVYACSAGDKVGHILDLRNNEERPSFANYAKKTSKELQEMLLTAMEEQKRQLIEGEGSGTETEKELDQEIKKIQRMSPDAADKEATKVLKAAKMTV